MTHLAYGVKERGLFNKFVECLNSIWESIIFTTEIENENRAVTFLDTVIHIYENMNLQHNHHVKPTSSNTYLHYMSHSSMNTKINIIRTEAARIIRNCSKLSFIYDLWSSRKSKSSIFKIKSNQIKIYFINTQITAIDLYI